MIITTNKARIVGFAPSVWHVTLRGQAWKDRHGGRDIPGDRTVAEADSLVRAYQLTLTKGLADPGQPLDLAGFHSFLRDTAKRFDGMHSLRLCEGYMAEQLGEAEPAAEAAAARWLMLRDTGRGGKHAVQIGTGLGVPEILTAAVWHAVFRERREMTAPEVGAYLTGIAHRLLDGATATTRDAACVE